MLQGIADVVVRNQAEHGLFVSRLIQEVFYVTFYVVHAKGFGPKWPEHESTLIIVDTFNL
jgi:hypothetical protein